MPAVCCDVKRGAPLAVRERRRRPVLHELTRHPELSPPRGVPQRRPPVAIAAVDVGAWWEQLPEHHVVCHGWARNGPPIPLALILGGLDFCFFFVNGLEQQYSNPARTDVDGR